MQALREQIARANNILGKVHRYSPTSEAIRRMVGRGVDVKAMTPKELRDAIDFELENQEQEKD